MEKLNIMDVVSFLISFIVAYFVLVYYPRILKQNALQRRLYQLQVEKTGSKQEEEQENFWSRLPQYTLFLVQKFNQQEIKAWSQALGAAGWRGGLSLALFLILKIITGVMGFMGAVALNATWDVWKVESLLALTILCVGVLGGFQLPNYIVDMLANRRRQIIERGVPDLLDMLVICTDAGLGVDASIERVASQFIHINRPLAEELNLLMIELLFIADRKVAIMNLFNRTQVKTLQVLATTLIQSERYGTALAQALKTLANEARNQQIMRAEEKAARLPATLTIPLVLLILPCLFIVILAPIFLKL